jgi:hypothetical protein
VNADLKPLLDTLIERWQEVAEAYKADDIDDATSRKFHDYRHIYLRNIGDLRHVLDTGQIPCSLMNDEERGRGDCGRIHDDADDKHGRPAPEQPTSAGWRAAAAVAEASATGPWGPGVTRHQAAMSVVTLHIAEALLDAKSEDVRTWARGLAHELKREQIDLLDEIGRHMQRMALGGPTNEVPF